jgi:hypothetical protein
MLRTGTSRSAFAVLAMLALGGMLGFLHARAWNPGGPEGPVPALSFDAAQYALAARTLAEHGTLATPFALPIDLVRNPAPPWPLSVVQPGMVVLEAALDRLVPRTAPWPAGGRFEAPERREWLPIALTFAAYLLLALMVARVVRVRLAALDPESDGAAQVGIALLAAASFLLDPEAQHLALGGFTELPFALGLFAALALLAAGRPARHPFAWGILLGVTGTLRGTLFVLMPVLAAGAAALVPAGRRVRVAALVIAGYAVPLVAWWIYKWRAFGTPAWDLSSLALWDGVGGRTWFSLTHLPELPVLPVGGALWMALSAKFMTQLGPLLAMLALSVAGVAAIVVVIALWRAPAVTEFRDVAPDPAARRAARVTATVILVNLGLALVVAALGAGWRRYLFPARVPLEAAGFVALWLTIERARRNILTGASRRVLVGALAALALGWGALQTLRGNAEAASSAGTRGLPAITTLHALAAELDARLAPGETVMSNLGPTLAWYARRPVLHLALAPEDVAACRAKTPFRSVLLVFRDSAHAWSGWAPLVAGPPRRGGGLAEIGRERTSDGFTVVWLVPVN